MPPFLWAYGKRIAKLLRPARSSVNAGEGLWGEYGSWASALNASSGYDSDIILEKTRQATLSVYRGEAAYERDSVLFDEVKYAWPLLSGLMWTAAISGGRLHVLDFGGALGSAYFQNRRFLKGLRDVRWNVVEQAKHVKIGSGLFAESDIRFYNTIQECLAEDQPNVIIASGVLQYLQDPYVTLDQLLNVSCNSVIIDRTPFWDGASDKLTVQVVSPEIFASSYPMWIFSKRKFQNVLDRRNFVVPFRGFEDGMYGLEWGGYILS